MRLYQRFYTQEGPRTMVVQGLSKPQAYALMNSILADGGWAVVDEDGPQVNMREFMKSHQVNRRKKQIRVVS
jgi:hypothetical protein